MKQSDASIDETVALARLLGEGRNVVAREIEQALKALRLLVRMHVNALTSFRLTATQELARRRAAQSGQVYVHSGKVGGTQVTRSSDDLIAFVVGSDGNGLDESLGAKAFGKLGQLGVIEGAAGVGG